MSARSICGVAIALVLGVGCPPPEETPDQGPCGDTWGAIPEAGRIWSDPGAAEGGDGSLDAPFTTVELALDEARVTGIRSVVLAEGEYAGSFTLTEDAGQLDSGLELAGCGEGTVLVAVEDEEDGDDVIQPVIDVAGADTHDVVVRDLTIQGGRRALMARGGAGAAGPILFERIVVEDSVRVAVMIDGAATVAQLADVEVDQVDPEDGAFGWGVAVQTSVSSAYEITTPVTLEGVAVTGAHGVGVVADGAWVELTACTVEGTAPLDGLLGRGVHLQNWTRGTLDGLVATGNSDAAVFLHRPGREGAPVTIIDSQLSDTAASDVPEPDQSSGDGLSVTQGDDEYEAFTFVVEISGTTFEGNPRTHILAENVQVDVGSNNVFGDGTTYPIVSQEEALVTADEEVTELTGADVLSLNRDLLDSDEVTE